MPPKKVRHNGEDTPFVDPPPRISFKDLEKSMRPFSGVDIFGISTWIDDFEDIAILMQWGEIEIELKRSDLWKTITNRNCSIIFGWSDLKTKFKDKFGSKVNSAVVHKPCSLQNETD